MADDVLTGIEELRAVLQHGLPRPGAQELLGITFEAVEPGRVVLGADSSLQMANPLGIVHGGVTATLLDEAMSCAVVASLSAGEAFAGTLDLHVHFTRPIAASGVRMHATGSVVHRGHRVVTAVGQLHDGDGRLLAHGSTTCLIRETA